MSRLWTVIPALALAVHGALAQEKEEPGAEKEKAASGSPDRVELIDPGKEPRERLRLEVPEGLRQRLTLTIESEIQATPEGTAGLPAQKLPLQEVTVDLEVTGASGPEVSYDVRIARIELSGETPPPLIAIFRKATDQVEGLSGKVIISRRGIAVSARFETGALADPFAKQMAEGFQETLKYLTLVVPEEPVGLGSRWKVTRTTKHQGFIVEQASVYELEALEDGRGQVKVTVELGAKPQDMRSPGLPPGMNARLESYKGKGSGTVAFDLGKIAPRRAELRHAIDMRSVTSFSGAEQRMATRVEQKLRFREEAEKPAPEKPAPEPEKPASKPR